MVSKTVPGERLQSTTEEFLKNVEVCDCSFEGARLPAAPYIVFKDLRHGWKGVPFQNSNAESFPASSDVVPS
jgi:hypothetical protein